MAARDKTRFNIRDNPTPDSNGQWLLTKAACSRSLPGSSNTTPNVAHNVLQTLVNTGHDELRSWVYGSVSNSNSNSASFSFSSLLTYA
ncbi:hypothetical protein ACLKA6_014251 [Drosophila palustris]